MKPISQCWKRPAALHCRQISLPLRSAICLLLTLLFAIPAMADEPAGTSDENPLPRILRDWAKRRQDVGLVTYRYAGTRTWPQGAYNDMAAWIEKSASTNTTADNPEKDVTGIVKIKATLDFRNNRCRIESEEDDYFPLRRALYRMRLLTLGNDGIRTTQILEKNEPAAKWVDFVISKGNVQPEFLLDRRYHFPMLFASGVVPTKDQRVKEGNFALEVNSDAFVFERYTKEQGRTLAVLRVDGPGHGGYRATNHYWVDVERNSAIVKYTEKLGTGGERQPRVRAQHRIWPDRGRLVAGALDQNLHRHVWQKMGDGVHDGF